MEVCFADGANIDEDHGVQRTYDCNGVHIYPMRPMLELKNYCLVPSVLSAPPSGTTQQVILVLLLPTAAGADGCATKDDAEPAVKQGSRQRAQGSQSVKSSSSQHAKRRAQHARLAPTKKRKKVQSVSGYNLFHSINYGRILQDVYQMDRFKKRPAEKQINKKSRKKRAFKAALATVYIHN